MEQMKEKMMVKGKSKLTALLTEKEKTIDQKRECEFEIMQMADRNDRAIQREEKRVDKLKSQIA
jgi:hypothetical protein